MNDEERRALDYLRNALEEYACRPGEDTRAMVEERLAGWRAALPGESADESLIPTTGD